MKKLHLSLFYLLLLIYLEVVFRILKIESFFSLNLIHIVLYLIPVAIFLALLSRIATPKINKIINISFVSIICIWFAVHYIYSEIFNVYFSFSMVKLADQALTFWKDSIIGILNNVLGLIILLLPVLAIVLLRNKIDYTKIQKKELIISLVIIPVSYLLFLGSLFIGKNNTYSPYELYFKVNNNALGIEKLGVLNSSLVDIRRLITGFTEEIEVIKEEKEEVETKYDYNITEIDFEKLLNEEKDNTIKSMHEYFASDTGTLKNEYTGYYKDKNLILFMAESFNEIAVSKELTPTLYKLINSSFVFNNFYTPVNNSTIGGEFQELTGLFANSSIFSIWKSGNNSFPYGISNVFENLNYSTFAYHNNSYTFQNRNKYLKSLGFDNFLACRNGLEKKINCKMWPQSDVDMINTTYQDWINEEQFMVFYATVSGHGEYSWSNNMSKKHKELVKDLDYSEKVKAYLAAQIELDRALETLLLKLEENDRLEDTVIALVGDHYPYYLSLDQVNEVAKYKKDSVVEINRSNFILWNSKTPTIEIDKVGSQIDVLPTIYNIFGIDYDSRLIIGRDILSTEPGLAIFNDRSWTTDYGTYFISKGEFVPKKDVKVSEDYVENMCKKVDNKVIMSQLILEKDYYKKVIGD